MLNKLKLHHGKKHQPLPRVGHVTVAIGDRLYLWGGWNKSLPRLHSNSDKISSLSVVDVFNLRTGTWDQIPTGGIPPLGVAYYSCAHVDEDLYYFGGRCGHGGCHHNTIHRLSTVTMKWRDATPSFSESEDSPMKKAQCGMVHLEWKGEDHLLVAGGYGLLPVHHLPNATYVPKRGNPEYGWTNEAHLFNIKTGKWAVPEVTGEAPPPCSNFSMVSLGDNRGAMYGGFQPEAQRISDVYVMELIKDTIYWSKLCSNVNPSTPQPPGSCDNVMTYIAGYHGDRHSPCLLVQGGENEEGETLSDCWIMELRTAEWKKVSLPPFLAKRIYHSLSSVTVGPHCIWVVLFGGVAEMEDMKDWQDQPMLSNTVVIELVKRPSEDQWTPSVVYDISNTPSKTSAEDYMKKLGDRVFQGRKDWLSLVKKDSSLLPAREERERANRAELRADTAEQQAAESRRKVEHSETLMSTANQTAVKERRESVSLLSDLSDTRRRAQSAQQELIKAKADLVHVRHDNDRLKNDLTVTERKLDDIRTETREEILKLKGELHSNSLVSTDSGCCSSVVMETVATETSPNWLIDLKAVVTDGNSKRACRSGALYEGEYCGVGVSVKQLSKGGHTTEEFTRTMDQLSTLRHPNLVLFMGAIMGNKQYSIITETLPLKPLNVLIEESPLSRGNLLKIARGVALALVCLHQRSPSPLTHGTVSSQVVYLDTLPGGGCGRPKLSDSCLYPLYSRPLAAYAPPEAEATPKMDVYSFGVLLIEMCCRKALVSSQSEREKQVQHVNWPEMAAIISQDCLHSDPGDRASSEHVYTNLTKLN